MTENILTDPAFVTNLKAEAKALTGENTSNKNIITGEDLLLSNVEKIPFLLEGLLHQIGLGCIAGSSDTGKSCLLRQLAMAIVRGDKTFLGFLINAIHKSAIFVSSEDNKEATAYLLKKQFSGGDPASLKGLRFIFDWEDLLSDLDKSLTEKPADFVGLDCFQDIYGGDLKDTQKIRTFLHPFQKLAEKHNSLFLFLHHTGKRTENMEPSKNNLLSSQGMEAKLRLAIELRQDLILPDVRHLCIVKGNYLSGKSKRESFVLNFNEKNFTFTDTGFRTPFEDLARLSSSEDREKAKYLKYLELTAEGIHGNELAEALGYSSRGSVTKLKDKGEKNGWNK